MSVTLKITDWQGDIDLAMAHMHDVVLLGPDLPPTISYRTFDSEDDAWAYADAIEESRWNGHCYDGVDMIRCNTDYDIVKNLTTSTVTNLALQRP